MRTAPAGGAGTGCTPDGRAEHFGGGYAASATRSGARLRPGVPAVEVAGELVVEDAGADLEQEVGAAGRPAHLLLLTMRLLMTWLTADSVKRGGGGGDGLTRAVAFPGRTGCNFGSGGVLSRVGLAWVALVAG